jgi:S1-C subfamily serine protease
MNDETKEIEQGANEPSRVPRRLVLAGLGAALVVVAAAAGGAIAGHELWSSTHKESAPAIVANPSPGSGGFSGSFGSGSGARTSGDFSAGLVDVNSTFSYQGAGGAGTGIVISSDGEVLTNNHVIDGATKITATDIENGKTYDATVVGYDPSHDVAVLKLQDASGLTTAKLGDSSSIQVGDSVTGVGNAGGVGGTPSSAEGSITGLNQSITAGDAFGGTSERLSGLIRTDADIQPGDSGGPLVDSQGRVIGMNTAGSAGFQFSGGSGQAFAIPINDALKIALQVVSGKGSATTHVGPSAFLGVSVVQSGSDGFGFGGFDGSSPSTTSGLQIGGVLNGEAADKAGLAAGDVITGFDGKSVDSRSSLSAAMLQHHPGDIVKLDWVDASGSSHSSSVVLGSGPPA